MNERRRASSSSKLIQLMSEDVVTRPRSIERIVETTVQGTLDGALIAKVYDRLYSVVELMPDDLQPTLWIFDVQRITKFNSLNYREPAGKLFDYVAENVGKEIILVTDDRPDSGQPILMNASSLALGRLKIHHAKASDEAERIVLALRSVASL